VAEVVWVEELTQIIRAHLSGITVVRVVVADFTASKAFYQRCLSHVQSWSVPVVPLEPNTSPILLKPPMEGMEDIPPSMTPHAEPPVAKAERERNQIL